MILRFDTDYKSKVTFLGIPLVHIAFGNDANGCMRIAKGWIAIGQTAVGLFTIAQFGIGLITIAQFGIGLLFGFGQFMAATTVIGQFVFGLLPIIGSSSPWVLWFQFALIALIFLFQRKPRITV